MRSTVLDAADATASSEAAAPLMRRWSSPTAPSSTNLRDTSAAAASLSSSVSASSCTLGSDSIRQTTSRSFATISGSRRRSSAVRRPASILDRSECTARCRTSPMGCDSFGTSVAREAAAAMNEREKRDGKVGWGAKRGAVWVWGDHGHTSTRQTGILSLCLGRSAQRLYTATRLSKRRVRAHARPLRAANIKCAALTSSHTAPVQHSSAVPGRARACIYHTLSALDRISHLARASPPWSAARRDSTRGARASRRVAQ